MEIDKLVKTQSDYIARSLTGFWKIAKVCMDGKYRKVSPKSLLCGFENAD